MKKSRKKDSYIKCDKYVEVSCLSSASYEELCETCADALDMDFEGDDSYLYDLRMSQTDGTMVPNKPIGDHPWTISEYLRVQR